MSDDRRQEPGGWKRVVLYVESLDSMITRVTEAAVRFPDEVEAGPGGKQLLVDAPRRESDRASRGAPKVDAEDL
jgi:glyoxylase I family protein